MIKLKVEPYCYDCLYFKPKLTHWEWRPDGVRDNYISCKNAPICNNFTKKLHKEAAIIPENETTMAQPVYLVIVSTEADDCYYADYEDVKGVYSSREKAEEIVAKLLAKYKDAEPWQFKDAKVVEHGLDKNPEELNDD